MTFTPADQTIYGAYGEFDATDTSTWTDEEWAAYDADIARQMQEWDAAHPEDFDPYVDYSL